MENINECPTIVAAACVLHNFSLLANEENIDEFLDEFNGDDGDDDYELPAYSMFQDYKLLQREIKWLSFSTTNTCNS